MIPRRQVSVALDARSYEITIGVGLLAEIARRCRELRPVTHGVLITDDHVAPHAAALAGGLQAAGIRTDTFTIAAGEQSKQVASAAALWDDLLASGADRRAVVFAVGGGVVGDLAGFVAATYARGIDCVQIPTTLLAAVDSSVGGKTGVNLTGAKNMVGCFWQPLAVFVDLDTFATLPAREFRAGLAEVVKYGVILDADFFTYLEAHVAPIQARDPLVLTEVIAHCCRLKANVVEADERETTGLRAVLNYGHTFAHALEAITQYGELLHGEAVSIGMLCASRLAESLGRIPPAITARQQRLLTALGLPTAVPDVDRGQLVSLMQHDKKVEHGQLRFVLPSRLGQVELVSGISPAQALAALAAT